MAGILFLINLFACGKAAVTDIKSSVEKPVKSTVRFDGIYNETTYDGYPVITYAKELPAVYREDILSHYLDNPNAFLIEVVSTKMYDNFFFFDEKDELKVDAVKSHMLTAVQINEIFYSGENIDFKKGHRISMREAAFICENWYNAVGERPEEKSIFIPENFKLFPDEEYLILGEKVLTREGSGEVDSYEFKYFGASQIVGLRPPVYIKDTAAYTVERGLLKNFRDKSNFGEILEAYIALKGISAKS